METNWSGTRTNLTKKKKIELAGTYILRRNNDSNAKQALQLTPQGLRNKGRPKNTWKIYLEKEMWTAGFRYSWRKMEAVAQDRAGWRQVVCGLGSTGSEKT